VHAVHEMLLVSTYVARSMVCVSVCLCVWHIVVLDKNS